MTQRYSLYDVRPFAIRHVGELGLLPQRVAALREELQALMPRLAVGATLSHHETGEVVACGALFRQRPGVAHAWFALRPHVQGVGIVRAIASFWGAHRGDFHRVQTTHVPGNETAKRLLEWCEFQYEGTMKHFAGAWQDRELWAWYHPTLDEPSAYDQIPEEGQALWQSNQR